MSDSKGWICSGTASPSADAWIEIDGDRYLSVSRTTEIIVRDHYGRLLAYLASLSRDITLAEEALSDALVSALETWPQSGVPANPEGWLIKVAHRKIIDIFRRHKTQASYLQDVQHRFICCGFITITEAEGSCHPFGKHTSRFSEIISAILGGLG